MPEPASESTHDARPVDQGGDLRHGAHVRRRQPQRSGSRSKTILRAASQPEVSALPGFFVMPRQKSCEVLVLHGLDLFRDWRRFNGVGARMIPAVPDELLQLAIREARGKALLHERVRAFVSRDETCHAPGFQRGKRAKPAKRIRSHVPLQAHVPLAGDDRPAMCTLQPLTTH